MRVQQLGGITRRWEEPTGGECRRKEEVQLFKINIKVYLQSHSPRSQLNPPPSHQNQTIHKENRWRNDRRSPKDQGFQDPRVPKTKISETQFKYEADSKEGPIRYCDNQVIITNNILIIHISLQISQKSRESCK